MKIVEPLVRPGSGADPCVSIEPSVLYFGTPVVLLSTENPDATVNLAPISSAWALGQVIVLGLGPDGQTAHNLAVRPDLVINIAAPGQWQAVERLAPLTGRHPVPATKLVPGTDHIDPAAWSPLIYNFRHYFSLGPELGQSYRSATPRGRMAQAPGIDEGGHA